MRDAVNTFGRFVLFPTGTRGTPGAKGRIWFPRTTCKHRELAKQYPSEETGSRTRFRLKMLFQIATLCLLRRRRVHRLFDNLTLSEITRRLGRQAKPNVPDFPQGAGVNPTFTYSCCCCCCCCYRLDVWSLITSPCVCAGSFGPGGTEGRERGRGGAAGESHTWAHVKRLSLFSICKMIYSCQYYKVLLLLVIPF